MTDDAANDNERELKAMHASQDWQSELLASVDSAESLPLLAMSNWRPAALVIDMHRGHLD